MIIMARQMNTHDLHCKQLHCFIACTKNIARNLRLHSFVYIYNTFTTNAHIHFTWQCKCLCSRVSHCAWISTFSLLFQFVELGTAERNPESPWTGIWRGSREKRSPKKKKNKPVKIRHKSCCKPKVYNQQGSSTDIGIKIVWLIILVFYAVSAKVLVMYHDCSVSKSAAFTK